MIINAAFLALKRLVTPQLRWILWKSLGLTLVLLAFFWFAVRDLFLIYLRPWIGSFMPDVPDWTGWVGIFAAIFSGFGLAVILAFLIAPITALIGSFFMDEVAEIIEKEDFPAQKSGKALLLGRSLVIACHFLVLSLAGNLIALVLLLVPGINMIAFLVINGYLLGREYFTFAAARFRPQAEVYALYKQNTFTVFLVGLMISLFLSVPILNLATPLFAAATMTYLHKFLSGTGKQKQRAS